MASESRQAINVPPQGVEATVLSTMRGLRLVMVRAVLSPLSSLLQLILR